MCRQGYIPIDVCIARLADLISLVLRRNFEDQLYSCFPSCQNMMVEMWNSLHRLRYLNTLVLFVEGIGGAVLLEEVYYWGWALKVHSLAPLPVHSFCFLSTGEGIISQLSTLLSCPLLASMLPHCNGQLPLWNYKPKETFPSVSLLCPWCFIITTEKPQYTDLSWFP